MSKTLSKQAVATLASNCTKAANVIIDFMKTPEWRALPAAEKDEYIARMHTLHNANTTLSQMGLDMVIDESVISIKRLKGAIEEAKEVLKKIKKVKDALVLAGAVAQLAVAVIGKDLGGTAEGVKAIYEAAKELTGKDADTADEPA